ncbi:MAG: aminopeptidase P N-terminal domain-containing protein [Eubacteriales bacterium]|nr:aminopeptidase P N-terminal domain-containing protein [Eubacteriales bacterium]
MKKHKLSTAYFQKNRQALGALLTDGSLVILASGSPPVRSSDAHYRYLANRNFFYLTGIEQEGSLLVMFREFGVTKSTLFIPGIDAMHERWNGRRVTRQEAMEQSGLTDVLYIEGFEGQLADWVASRTTKLWLDTSADNPQAKALKKLLSDKYASFVTVDVSPLMTQLRMIKQPEELDLIREAANLTGEGILAMMKACRPGAFEYHLWSEFQYTLSQAGCLEPAFESIVASGKNALCLHYMTPMERIADGDLVQLDVGAVVGGLCADISRALPANGRFSPQQRAIYDLVRACQETAFATIKPGIRIAEINDACQATAREGLLAQGLLQTDQPVKEYFWHGVSHHMGLDVHDVSNKESLLKPGMVLTVEPGIYIPEWGFGMRLEDDVVVTDEGCRLLSAGIPREADEIEALMLS